MSLSMNATRADWAHDALRAFAERSGDLIRLIDPDDEQDAIADLICDLLHHAASKGYEPIELAKRGVGMWSAEHRDPDTPLNDLVEIVVTRDTFYDEPIEPE